MSSTGNRSNPDETRVAARGDGRDQQAPDASGTPGTGRRGGAAHRETREHNKHNGPGRDGHSPAQEKH